MPDPGPSAGTVQILVAPYLRRHADHAIPVRVFLPLVKLRLQQLVLRLQMRLRFFSREDQRAATIRWFESLLPIGKNPFEFETTYRSWVGEFALRA
jgi:hypothetical protein